MIFYSGIIIALLIGITVHEASHALAAYLLGDPTAKYEGRITLNPTAHLDPIGTLMIAITFITGIGFGWGKPVPYNPRYLKNPRIGAMIIALAGPFANLLCAMMFSLILNYAIPDTFVFTKTGYFITTILEAIVVLNVALMAFNLIPIPPLDGSKVLAAIFPPEENEIVYQLFKNGPFILIGLIIFEDIFRVGVIRSIIQPLFDFTLLFIGMST